ncbi:uncharacterized protein LOC144461887 [Epinephelus lanceolatus]
MWTCCCLGGLDSHRCFLQFGCTRHTPDSTRCWKHSSEMLVHIDMMTSHSCCRFVSCTSMMEVAIRRWVHCGHEGMDTVSNNTQIHQSAAASRPLSADIQPTCHSDASGGSTTHQMFRDTDLSHVSSVTSKRSRRRSKPALTDAFLSRAVRPDRLACGRL